MNDRSLAKIGVNVTMVGCAILLFTIRKQIGFAELADKITILSFFTALLSTGYTINRRD